MSQIRKSSFIICSFLLIGISVLMSCSKKTVNQQSSPPKQNVEKSWVQIDPVQCLGNPWEKHWMSVNGKESVDYPADREFEIVKRFYGEKGIDIHKIRSEQTHEYVCEACTCPRGLRARTFRIRESRCVPDRSCLPDRVGGRPAAPLPGPRVLGPSACL